MYRFILAGCLAAGFGLCFSFGPVLGQDEPEKNAEAADEEAPEISSNLDKVSYGIGQNFGKNLSRDELDLNVDLLILGIRDALAKKKSRLSEEDINAAMQEFLADFESKQAERQKAKEEANKKEGEEFLGKNGKKKGVKTLKSGLQYEVLAAGDGPSPKKTDTVKTHYHGTLIDGTVFDSSVDRGEPATFGVNQVIKGWTEALQMMKVGDKWRIFVPAELAYGSRGAGQAIGPNAALIFEIELLGIEKSE
ncbi:MAG: FKBP-type peptidyl-prolyl cis-trans isomerase [Planctomycetota bacterium]|nr:FKBP-type peptidyl-prolyl cis-trans isomerase [Planctomycetota bacterium]MDA1211498.1 FKBP-type peptidyl-prolyl cis-trans isomerase [Planctomycetota bacterium]